MLNDKMQKVFKTVKQVITSTLPDPVSYTHLDVYKRQVTIKGFVRFETGEGIEKKEEDFAAEVAAQLK